MKKGLLILVAFLFVFPSAFAQLPDGVITGRILEDGTNNGIWRAAVTATKIEGDPFERTVQSGWNGHYGIPHLPPGPYVVTATKPGWSDGVYPETLIVNNDAHHDIDIYLTEIQVDLGSISGTITDAGTSAPIEAANVIARGPGFWNYRYTTSDANGDYTVGDLEPGMWHITVHKEGYHLGQYPDPIEINGNDTTDIDVALVLIVPTGMRGTITDNSSGNPIEGARVIAKDLDNWYHHYIANTDANGDYQIDAPPGEYLVRAMADGYLPAEYPANVVVPDSGYVEDIDIALTGFSYGSISGMVTDTSGAGVYRARIIAWRYDSFFARHALSDETGAYTIENLIPGNFRVHAHKWGFEPQVYPDTVVVPDGGNVPNIDFVLSPPAPLDGIISGTVTDDSTGQPIEGVSVLAFAHTPNPWHHWYLRRVFTDENGDYIFDNLPDFEFRIFAHAPAYIGEFYDNVQHYSDATIVIPDAENIDFGLAPIEVPGLRSIYGRVVDTEGGFLEGGFVYLESGGEIVNITATDLEGYYGFAGILPGVYNLSAVTEYGEVFYPTTIEIAFEDYGNADIVVDVTSADESALQIPVQSGLDQNYPNPFNAQTSVSFNLSSENRVELSVYNIIGQKVITLAEGVFEAGRHKIIWDGKDSNGNDLASGIYYYRLQTDDFSDSKRMTLLK